MAKKKKKDEVEEVKEALLEPKKDTSIPTENMLSLGSTTLNLACMGRTNAGFAKGFVVLVVGDSNSGKAQPLDAKVLTPSGWKTMGEMRPGTIICDPDGETGKVANVYPQGLKDVFKVEFSDGTSTECTEDHLWAVTYVNRGGHRKDKILSLKEIRNNITKKTPAKGKPRYYLPLTKPVRFRWNEVPIDPYLLGLLLGDGHLGKENNNHIGFSTRDDEILDEIRKRLPTPCHLVPRGLDYDICADGKGGKIGNSLSKKLRGLGLKGTRSDTKYIPECYLKGSPDTRIQLLQGLLDTDGYASSICVEYTTVSKNLLDGIIELVRSLGGTAKERTGIGQYTYRGEKRKGKRHYTLTIKLPPTIQPFLLKRKQEIYKARNRRNNLCKRITKIIKVGSKQCQCISTTCERSRYITNDYIVTHNTWLSRTIFAEAANNPNFDNYQFVEDLPEHGANMDVESYFGKKLAERLEPMNGTREEPEYSKTLEEFYDNLHKRLDQGPVICLLDSMDALEPEDDIKREQERKAGKKQKGTYGTSKPKVNSQKLRPISNRLAETGSILIIISQTRQNIGFTAKFSPRTRSGGDALKFYSRIEMWLSIKERLVNKKYKDRFLGQVTKVKIAKNHFTGWEGFVYVTFIRGHGIDDIGGCIDFLSQYHWSTKGKDVDKSIVAPEFDFTGKKEALVQYIEENKKEKELRKLVRKVWYQIEKEVKLKRKKRYD